jgi:hypothetical protein
LQITKEDRARPWNPSEELQVVKLRQKHGNCWAKIAREIGGRTDNDVKNRFYKISKEVGESDIDKLVLKV